MKPTAMDAAMRALSSGAGRFIGHVAADVVPKECPRCFAGRPRVEKGFYEFRCLCGACGHRWEERRLKRPNDLPPEEEDEE